MAAEADHSINRDAFQSKETRKQYIDSFRRLVFLVLFFYQSSGSKESMPDHELKLGLQGHGQANRALRVTVVFEHELVPVTR